MKTSNQISLTVIIQLQVAIIIVYRMLIFDCKIVGTDRWSALKNLPISHFLLIHFYSVNGVR